MTKEERIIYWLNDQYGEGNENVKLVKNALKKQIPKKPTKRNCNENGYYYCPACDGCLGEDDELEIIRGNYCIHCGQALDWE